MHCDFALIGDPVAHSLSPVMHNALYRHLGLDWDYKAIRCGDEDAAKSQIALVRTGLFRGMNITMPYKQLALAQADYIDAAADAAGGANVLVRKDAELHAYNTDGLGALGAIARVAEVDPRGKRVVVCGTGPTSAAIACAFVNAQAAEVVLFSRDRKKAQKTIDRIALSLPSGRAQRLVAADYEIAPIVVPHADVFVDATPRGMQPQDLPIIDTGLFHEGQTVLDVVYGHGLSALLAGARERGALGIDGLEMLVEQAALSVEIWARHMGLDLEVSRDVMRDAALGVDDAIQ